MSDNGSSPFLDSPAKFGFSYSRNSSATPVSATKQNNGDLLKSFNRLTYEVENLKNEKSIVKINHESSLSEIRNLLEKEQAKNIDLQSNLDFLYDQNKSLSSKLENLTQISEEKRIQNTKESSQLRNTQSELKLENSRLKLDQNEKIQSQSRKIDELNELVEQQESINERLSEKINVKTGELNRLNTTNNSLASEIQELKLKMSEFNPENESSSLFLQKELTSSLNLLATYEKTISKQKNDISQLLLSKKSSELLKEENLSLSTKLAKLESIRDELNAKEIESLKLKNQLEEFKVFFDRDGIKKPEDLINSYSLLQHENVLMKEKLYTSGKSIQHKDSIIESLNQTISVLQGDNRDLKTSNKSKDDLIAKLDRQKKLSLREIELLRNQLKSFDELDQTLANHDNSTISNTNDQYLKSLEKLIDDYKNENIILQSQLRKQDDDYKLGNKRMRKDDFDTNSNEKKISNLEQKLREYENENFKLQTELKSCQSQTNILKARLKEREKIEEKENEYRILMLKNNPASADQLIKQKMLDALRNENLDLLNKLRGCSDDIATIPKSLLDRNVLEQKQLEQRIYESNKKISRLREAYTKKSKEVIELIVKFLGYKFEFLHNNKIKIFPQYYNRATSNRNDKNYLLVDSDKLTFKIINDDSIDDLKFKNICENLIKFWIDEKNQIPCFLNALNLELYENYGKPI